VDPDPDPGGPKTRGSGGSGSATLHLTVLYSTLGYINAYKAWRLKIETWRVCRLMAAGSHHLNKDPDPH
jgi:hypothetical protein